MGTAFLISRWPPLCVLVSILAQGGPQIQTTQSASTSAHFTEVIVHRAKMQGDGGRVILPHLDWLGNELSTEFPDLRMEMDVDAHELQLWGRRSEAQSVAKRRKALAALGPQMLTKLRLAGTDAEKVLADLKQSFPGVRMALDSKTRTIIILARQSQLPEIRSRIKLKSGKADEE